MVLSALANAWMTGVIKGGIIKGIKDLFTAIISFLIFIFILGEFYAMYVFKIPIQNTPLLFWIPLGLLVVILIAKSMD